jgi:hypothetical protein
MIFSRYLRGACLARTRPLKRRVVRSSVLSAIRAEVQEMPDARCIFKSSSFRFSGAGPGDPTT